jgi:acetamidase/formamidase
VPEAVHVLPSTTDSVSSGLLDPRRPSALTVDSGDVVSYPDTWTQWGNQAKFGMSFADREPLRRQFPSGPYSNLGPVEVRGAEPGDALECRMLALRTIDWGWNSFPLGVGALPADFDTPYVHYFRFDDERRYAEFVDGIRITLAPSMGVFAVEPEGDDPVSAILAGPHGGNLDLAELVAGTSLFLPVFKSGARVGCTSMHKSIAETPTRCAAWRCRSASPNSPSRRGLCTRRRRPRRSTR